MAANSTTGEDIPSGIAYDTFSPTCGGGNDFDGRLGLHVAAIFIILVTSSFGTSSACKFDVI